MVLTINGTDVSQLVATMKVGKETLVSDASGRNAIGDSFIDIVNRKYKVYVGFRYMTAAEMQQLLTLIQDYVITVGFLSPYTGSMETITAYTGTPEPDYYTVQEGHILVKPMELNFIEL